VGGLQVCCELVAQGDVDGSEPQVEHALGREHQGREPPWLCLAQLAGDEHVGMRTRATSGDDGEQVIAALREGRAIGEQALFADGDPQTRASGHGWQRTHPRGLIRAQAHDDRPVRRTGLGSRQCQHGPDSLPSVASPVTQVAPSAGPTARSLLAGPDGPHCPSRHRSPCPRSGPDAEGRSMAADADGTLLGAEELVGEVAGVHHADPRTGFGVVEIDPGDGQPGERCSGPLADLVEGQSVRLIGRRSTHPRYGPTFEAMLYEQVTPVTVAGLAAFLSSERFAHLVPETIERVLTAFGPAAGAAIESGPDRLVAEADLEPLEARALHEAWIAGQALARFVRLVEGAGWPMDAVRSAHARFGSDVVSVARDDPYRLLEAERVRFAHVDALATRLGLARDDPRRLVAGAWAAVRAAQRQDGHQHLPRDEVLSASSQLLRVDAIVAEVGLERALAVGSLVAEVIEGRDTVATPGARRDETRLAEGVLRLLAKARPLGPVLDAAAASEDVGSRHQGAGVVLTEDQRAAVSTTLAAGVTVLTGGPGTGKSTTVRTLVERAERAGANVALAAPTGRAAKRLEELTGRPATTVHRLLEARPDEEGGFQFRFGAHEQLPFDLVVIDEVSMCDTWLAARLVEAVADGAHLVLVGDPDQLPSVGSGDVLRDLVASGVVPVAALTEIHRQAAGSRIIALARELLAGEIGHLAGIDGDVFTAEEPDRAAIAPRVVQAVAGRAPEYFAVSVDDVQVLAPVYRGPNGVDALNAALKAALNPAQGRVAVGGLHEGDRVMQTRNDAELDVANGDVGTVVDTDRREGSVRVAFPRGEVTYPRDRLRDLTPAWAITVHKSQGGEWPVVVLVLDPAHRGMLWRNLAYTAVTRASRALILVGHSDALRAAARHDRPSDRHTGLAWRLLEGWSGER
jgi:exodeoxyribonuclease V alpha subunit